MPTTEMQPLAEELVYRILIVEDNPNDRILYKRLLNKNAISFQIYEADTVEKGLEISCQEKFDCILLDYHLPDADGIDFIKSWARKGQQPDIAIIMVTGQGDERTAVEAMKLGALDYITKNLIVEGFFVQSILNAIERAHLKHQVKQYQNKLEKSYAELSDFTHTVSHDLKAPLRRISQYCDILKEEVADKLDQQQIDYIDRLRVNAARLHALVGDLLTYSRTMSAKETKIDLDLCAVVNEVIEDLKVLMEENHATINCKNLPIIPAFPVRMKELFQNLIENSLKYRGEREPIITISCDKTARDYVFSIQDNGIGIDEKYHEKIFKAFERLHTQEELEGSGLGLSICSKVVEMHDGKIWVESKPGAGALFKFTIPKS